jgi:hypothetical protein
MRTKMNAISTISRFIVGNVIIYTQIFFHPCHSFCSSIHFHYEKKKNSQVKDNIHRKERERERERERRGPVDALCPGKCQLPVSGPPAMGHSPRLLLFRQSTTLSLSLSLLLL